MRYILTFLVFVSIKGICQDKLAGYYASKSPDLGFFVTRIQLNDDWTFKYEFRGDLAYNWGDGRYDIDIDNVVVLIFGESDLDSAEQITQALSGGHEIFGTMFYVYKKRRLYYLKSSGKLDKKGYLIKYKDRKLIWRHE